MKKTPQRRLFVHHRCMNCDHRELRELSIAKVERYAPLDDVALMQTADQRYGGKILLHNCSDGRIGRMPVSGFEILTEEP